MGPAVSDIQYVRDIYQIPAIRRSVNMRHIKVTYFSSHPALNPYAIVPVGPAVDFDAPHGRERLS